MSARFTRGSPALAILVCFAEAILGTEAPNDKAGNDPSESLPKHALVRLGSQRWRTTYPLLLCRLTDNDKRILTVNVLGEAISWETATGKKVDVAMLESGAKGDKESKYRLFRDAALDPQSRMLAALDDTGAAQLWNAATGKKLHSFADTKWQLAKFAFSADGKTLVAVGLTAAKAGPDKNKVQFLFADTQTGKATLRPLVEQEPVPKMPPVPGLLSWSADGKSLVFGHFQFGEDLTEWEFIVSRLDPTTGKVGKQLAIIDGGLDARISPDGRLMAVVGKRAIHILDHVDDKLSRKLTMRLGQYAYPVFSPDNKQLLAIDAADKGLAIWDVETGKRVRQQDEVLKGVRDNGTLVTLFAADGKSLYYTAEACLRRIDLASGEEMHQIAGHTRSAIDLNFSSDGKTLVTQAEDSSIRRWDAVTGKELGQIALPDDVEKGFFLLSPDFKTLLTAGPDGKLRVWDAVKLQARHVIQEGKRGEPFRTIVFAPDARRAAVLDGLGRHVRLYDVDAAKLLHELEMPRPKDRVAVSRAAQFAPDGKKLAAVSTADRITVWDTSSGEAVNRIDIAGEPDIRQIAFSPDGAILALDYYDGTTVLWDLINNKRRAVLNEAVEPPGQKNRFSRGADYAYAVTFSPNGRWLAKIGTDGKVSLWDVQREKLHAVLDEGGFAVSLAFSPSGRVLASSYTDGTVLLWNADAVFTQRDK